MIEGMLCSAKLTCKVTAHLLFGEEEDTAGAVGGGSSTSAIDGGSQQD
jgi:hypothetical protein